MSDPQWRRVSEVFALVHAASADRRDAILSEQCGEDGALRAQVRALLAHELPSTPAAEVLAAQLAEPPERLIGATLGCYTLLEPIGEGGMGRVFRARDNDLQRDVAVKVLAPALAADQEWRTALAREARVLASLNHRHIAVIHGMAEGDGLRGLVMELVDGETLAVRLSTHLLGHATAPLPIGPAIEIAGQLASALEAAHERGVVHRDLKPANIALTSNGEVKVLDFGLARAPAIPAATGAGAGAPALAGPNTTTVVGTLPYMSPEQGRGRPVDKRADIFAFGCVLFEMLTGTRAFAGTDIPTHLAQVDAGPRWSDLPHGVPVTLKGLLRRCLDPDEKRRLRDIGEARVLLDDLQATPVVAPAEGRRWSPLALATAVLAVAGIAGLGIWRVVRGSTDTAAVSAQHLALPVGGGREPLVRGVAVSPGGRHVAFISSDSGAPQPARLCVRALERIEASCFAGTDGATSPFFSPDGQWIGYFAGRELRKVAVTGGPSTVVTDHVDPGTNKGGTWAPDGTIVYVNDRSLVRVSAVTGGVPVLVRPVDDSQGELAFASPLLLPDSSTLIYVVWFGPGWNERTVMAERLGSGESRALFRGAGRVRYAVSGHLVYSHEGTLTRVPFDAARLMLSGTPSDLAERVREVTATADWDLATDGTLAFVEQSATAFSRMPVLVDLHGNATPLPGVTGGYYQHPAISPDGRKAAFMRTSGTIDIWVYDFARAALAQLTTEGSSQYPVWSADGRRIFYRGTRGGKRQLYWRSVDATSPEEQFFSGDGWPSPWSASSDGRFVLFDQQSPGGEEISLLSLDSRSARSLATVVSSNSKARFSPDGTWFAYVSDRTGQPEVYAQSTASETRLQVSSGGGTEPVWAPDGTALYFRRGTAMISTRVTPGDPPAFGETRTLFDGQFTTDGPAANLDMHPDGQHFLMLQPAAADPPVRYINLVFHALDATAQIKR